MKNSIEISIETLLKITAVILSLWLLFLIKGVLVLLFVSIIIVSALEPLVDKLQLKKIPRVASAIILYLIFFSLVFFCLYLIIPVLIFELKQLGEDFPSYFNNINNFLMELSASAASSNLNIDLDALIKNLSEKSGNLISSVFSNSFSFFASLFKGLIIFALAFYMTVKKDGIKGFLGFVLPDKHKIYAIDLTKRIQNKMGSWLIGQLSIAFLIFGLEFLVLSLLGVPYALLLALVGGFFEIIPYIGPFISFIPAILIGLTVSPLTAILVGILYIVIQQMEHHIFTPLIMKKAVGLDPVVIIVALITGASLLGVLGMLIAIPFATALSVVIDDMRKNKFPK